jgi:hypothetical protein
VLLDKVVVSMIVLRLVLNIKCDNGRAIEGVHSTDYGLDMENSGLETGENVHTLERMEKA